MNSSALDKIRQAFDSDDAPTKNLALRLAFHAIDAMQEKCGRLENLNNSLALALEDERARIEALQADKAKLRETLKQIEASTYPRPLGKSWRMDLSSSKHDRCIHDEWMYDTCEGCLDDFIRKALQETER